MTKDGISDTRCTVPFVGGCHLTVPPAAGMTEIALKQPTAHEIVISGGLDPDPVLFGVTIDGSNSAPAYTDPLSFDATEDTILELTKAGTEVALTGLQTQPSDMLRRIGIIPILIPEDQVFESFDAFREKGQAPV